MAFLKKFLPKKVIRCTNCNTRFKFPVKPGKKLNVKCPNCSTQYVVSFVNPITQLIKGQLDWGTLSKIEKRKLIILMLTLLASLGLIFSSFKQPIKPNSDPISITESYAI